MDTELGPRIRALREELGLTQEQLARMSDLSSAHISRVENNERPGTQAVAVARIARALNTSADFLLGLRDDPVPPPPPPIEINPVRIPHARRLFEALTKLPRDRRDRVIDAMMVLIDIPREEADGEPDEETKEEQEARALRPRAQAAH